MCKAIQYGDEMSCSECGYYWDPKDPDPPKCKTRVELVPEISPLKLALLSASEGSGKSVCDCLAELVKDCLLSRDDDPAHVYGLEFIQKIDA